MEPERPKLLKVYKKGVAKKDSEHFYKLMQEAPLKIDPSDPRHLELLSKKKTPLSYLMFGITYECQCTCRHCCVGRYKKEGVTELSLDEIKNFLDNADYPAIMTLFGGEPTMRPDIFDIVQYASERVIHLFLDTNGLLVTKDFARKLKDNGLSLMYVSLDSPVREEHDAYRGYKGCYDQALRAVENGLEAGLLVLFSSYVTKESFEKGQFHEIVQIAKDMGATGVRYLLPEATGHWLYNPEVIMSPDEEKKVVEYALSEYPFVNRDYYFQNQTSSRCWGMQYGIYGYVSPYGEVQPCVFIPLTFGNIREESFTSIVRRMYSSEVYMGEITKETCVFEEKCPMISMDWRKKFIDTIPPGAKLPYRV